MSNTAIHTDNAPAAIGPYSQAIQAGSTIYVSGQLPIDPATGAFAGDEIKAQTRQSLTNIRSILAAAGTDMSAVVNKVMTEVMSEPYPARSCFAVAALPKAARVEIEAVVTMP